MGPAAGQKKNLSFIGGVLFCGLRAGGEKRGLFFPAEQACFAALICWV